MSSRSTPIGALRRDEDTDPSTRDMVNGIVNELEYGQGLPGGGYEDDMMEPMMDYGGGQDQYGQQYYEGAQMLAPGDPRGGGQMYQQPPQDYPQQYQQSPQHPPQEWMGQMGQMEHPETSEPRSYKKPMSFMDNLKHSIQSNVKEPLLAGALFLVMSNDMVSS